MFYCVLLLIYFLKMVLPSTFVLSANAINYGAKIRVLHDIIFKLPNLILFFFLLDILYIMQRQQPIYLTYQYLD